MILPEDADGYAIPAADLLADWFIEHGDDPDAGDPESWPTSYDSVRWTTGYDDLPDDADPDEAF